jgi:pyrophosphatase PpaX
LSRNSLQLSRARTRPELATLARALLFDFDGTLYGDWRIWISTIEETLNSFQITIDPHDALKRARSMIENNGRRLTTIRISNVAGAIAKDRGVNLEDELRSRFFEILDSRMDMTGPDHAVVDMLKKFQHQGFRMGIVTFVRKPRILHRLDVWKLKSFFGSVVTPDDLSEVKPSPKPFLTAMNQLHVHPRDSFVIGDEPVDMMGGKEAGASTIGIPQGFFTREELEKAGADHILDSFCELEGIVKIN